MTAIFTSRLSCSAARARICSAPGENRSSRVAQSMRCPNAPAHSIALSRKKRDMPHPPHLSAALRREHHRQPGELKAYLIVHYGLDPRSAEMLASDPLGSAAQIDSFIADVESLLRS